MVGEEDSVESTWRVFSTAFSERLNDHEEEMEKRAIQNAAHIAKAELALLERTSFPASDTTACGGR